MSVRTSAFEKYFNRHNDWFEKHSDTYQSELKALQLTKASDLSIENGAGKGKFAKPLAISFGVKSSENMYIKKQKH